jgi:hypothetical protein
MPRIDSESSKGGLRRWLFAICAACTAWLVVQNTLLIVLVWLGAWGRP